jgi:epoxyqueuosine reductase
LSEPNTAPVRIAATELAARLAELCPDRRIDLAGAVNLPCPLPLADRFAGWINEDRHGDLEYMTRAPEDRLDPTRKNPWARSMVVFAQRYTDGWSPADPDAAAGGGPNRKAHWTSRVSRYARGLDYHDVLLKDIRAVLAGLRTTLPDLTAYASTDTGPYLERETAWLAGLGFLGKNTCLIHERLGSGLFLGVALTNLEIGGLSMDGSVASEPLYASVPRRTRSAIAPPLSACGSCTRCIDACPTDAIGPDGGVNAGRCLSNFTIERQGQTPADFRVAQGGVLFGCDICQAVCPWNHRAADRANQTAPVPAEYSVREDHAELDLPTLAAISDEEFRRRFRRTPIWRCHPAGMRRNAALVLENLGQSKSDE